MKEIQLCNAEVMFSAVIDNARKGEPSTITRHGRREAIISFEEWERLSHVQAFGQLLAAAPLADADLLARPDGLRKVKF